MFISKAGGFVNVFSKFNNIPVGCIIGLAAQFL
jgi:hypothetical protein